jgi:hypothetical protein
MIINCIRDEPGSQITTCRGRWRMNQGFQFCEAESEFNL